MCFLFNYNVILVGVCIEWLLFFIRRYLVSVGMSVWERRKENSMDNIIVLVMGMKRYFGIFCRKYIGINIIYIYKSEIKVGVVICCVLLMMVLIIFFFFFKWVLMFLIVMVVLLIKIFIVRVSFFSVIIFNVWLRVDMIVSVLRIESGIDIVIMRVEC